MKYLRKELSGMTPYHSEYITEGIILNGNESPFNVPQEILDLFALELKNIDFNRYPDMDNTIIRESIAKAYNVKITNVTCGVGSDEMIDTIFKGVITKGDNVVLMKPSFSMYKEFARIHDANAIEASCNPDFTFNLDNMLKAIKENNPKMVILCSPNNPTGIVLSEAEVRTILDASNCLVLLDEAYVEFYGEGLYNLINEYDNLIILRTFSKLYALASMRCGYAISNEANIDLIDTVKSPYNLNVITQRLASVVISNKNLYKERIEFFKSESRRLYNEFKTMKIEVYPTVSNFLWLRLSDKINKALLDNKIYIRKMMYDGVMYNRICVGTKEENDMLLKVVRENA